MKAGQHSQELSSANLVQLTENDEGGLELGQVLAAIRRKVLLIAGVTVVVASAALLKALTDTPVYSAGFEILTEPVTAESEVISSVPDTLSSRQEQVPVTLDETKIRVLQSPSLLAPVVEELQEQYPNVDYNTIYQSLGIQTSGQNILQVTYQSQDPEFVRAVLNIVSEAYLNYSLEDRQKDVQQGISFVEEQLPKLEERLADKQEELQSFRQRYNLIDPDVQATQLTQQGGAFSQQQLDTQTKLNEARLLYSELRDELARQPTEIAAASALSASPRYQKLLDQLLEVDSQLAQESTLYLNGSPEIEVLREQRQNLLPLLQQEGEQVARELASQIEELETRDRALSRSISGLNEQVRQLAVITRNYTDIQRELQIATDNLNQFLAKREGLRIDAAQRQIPWQLLTPPGEPQPSAASVKRNLLLGTILGLLLGVGVALVIDKFSSIIYTPKDIKSITKLPLLGVIPFEAALDESDSSRGAVVWLEQAVQTLELIDEQEFQQQTSTPFVEAFRSIYANICLINPDAPIRSLVISSATPNSGKTTVARHLAQAASAMGQRVLLVDTDLRRPSLHHHLGLRNVKGLTDVVSTNLDISAAIQKVTWESSLFIITAGSISPDPTRVLSSQAMQHFMEKSRESFDLVIYDTPPLLGFADTSLLSTRTDGILLVARLGQLKSSLLEQALEELNVSASSVLGIVANASKDHAILTNSYHQYYADTSRKLNFMNGLLGKR